MNEAERRAYVLLTLVKGLGPRKRSQLMEAFGSPETILSSSPHEIRSRTGISEDLAQRIVRAESECQVDEVLELCAREGIQILLSNSPRYPPALKEIPDPPDVLFMRGDLNHEDRRAIAMVGARRASTYGKSQAARLARELVQAGFTVISGLARGIDGAAHQAALDAGGRTLAVLANGLATIYPPEHASLADHVAENGALISETPPRFQVRPRMFPQRNRIISGLTLGVIVVEAAERSGALITARHALEQGREVFAMPGPVHSPTSRGCHRLLRDGARLIESVDDVLDEIGPLLEHVESVGTPANETPRATNAPIAALPEPTDLSEEERKILSQLEQLPVAIDQVVTASGLPAHQVLATLSSLEMRRLIRRLEGNRIERC